jgi:hypothetical protein
VSEDKMHLLKDEFVLQPHQADTLGAMLIEAASIVRKHTKESSVAKMPARKKNETKFPSRSPLPPARKVNPPAMVEPKNETNVSE